MDHRNWLFTWTELGARHVGIMQSLLVTCRLHDIDPYDYFVDVLQRIDWHSTSQVHQLTPRLWKKMFAATLCVPPYMACKLDAITPLAYRLPREMRIPKGCAFQST